MSVTAVAQVKIMREPVFLSEAAQQLLGKTETEIKEMLLYTLEGHLRSGLGRIFTPMETFRIRKKLN